MTPRLPPHSTVTIKTDVDRFYVGDIIAFRNPVNRFDSTPLLREVIAGPGSLIEGEGGDSSFTLEDNTQFPEPEDLEPKKTISIRDINRQIAKETQNG